MAQVSFIGLGIMGSGMVENLIKVGHSVTVWNRDLKKLDEVAKLGAKTCADPAELVASADFLLYCLSDDAAINDVIIKGHQLASKVNSRTIAINLSTIDPLTSDEERKIYESRGVEFLDAPVFGTKGEAHNGGLWIVVGGKKETFEKARVVLEPLSETLHYMGVGGSGVKMKLVGNLLVASQLEALGEALTLAKKSGLNLSDVLEVLAVADFKTPIYNGVGHGVIKDDYEVNFSLKLMLKDARLIKKFAARLNTPVPSVSVAEKFIEQGIAAGYGELNASVIVKVIAKEGAVDLVGQ